MDRGPVLSSADGTKGFHALFYGLPANPLATTRALYQINYSGTLPRRGASFEATLRTAVGDKTTTDRVSVVQISGP
jgi:hypothetical protein